MIIRTHTDNRKALAKAISKYIGEPIKYMGLPSFSYQTGLYTIDRDGTIICEDNSDCEKLKPYLAQLGYLEPELETFEISVPIHDMDGAALRNLVYMLHSEQYLLNKVVGHADFSISENLVQALETDSPLDKEAFLALYRADSGESKGIAFDDEKATFTFTLSDNPDKNRAYAEVAAFMAARAKKARRISYIEQKPENEKYYFRVWLLRLGFTGNGGKASRKALLGNLKGHTAFRTPTDADKHKAKLLARKAAACKDEK